MKGLIDGRRGGIAGRTALIAQLVEHLICNQGVPGSSPGGGTILSLYRKSPGGFGVERLW